VTVQQSAARVLLTLCQTGAFILLLTSINSFPDGYLWLFVNKVGVALIYLSLFLRNNKLIFSCLESEVCPELIVCDLLTKFDGDICSSLICPRLGYDMQSSSFQFF